MTFTVEVDRTKLDDGAATIAAKVGEALKLKSPAPDGSLAAETQEHFLSGLVLLHAQSFEPALRSLETACLLDRPNKKYARTFFEGVANLGGMNQGGPFANFAVSSDFILVIKKGAPLLKLHRASGEWEAFDQFRHDWPAPVVAGREAFISLETEIARMNLETDAVTTLVRTRREPAESPLDNPRHLRVWALPGPDGLPIVQAADAAPNGQTTASFSFDPASGAWEKCAPFFANERAVHRCVPEPEARERWETRGEKRGIAYVRTDEAAGQRHDAVCPIPLQFALPQTDRVLLTSREHLTKGSMREIETLLEAAEKTIETPDGLILFRFMTPGFWFVPNDDLARYVTDPRSLRPVP